MAIYLSRKKGGVTPTSITPSNSSPAQMTANVAVNPTANGYAIQSYDSVTPSGTPTSVSSGDIVKIGGSGVIVDSVPTPTSITPSNSSPVALSANTPVNPTDSGYAIASYSDVSASYTQDVPLTLGNIYKATSTGKFVPDVININPTNASPVTLSYPRIYRNIAEYGGVAIGGFVNKTPDDSNPPSISSGAIIKASASGYLYSTIQKFKQGSVTLSTSSQTSVTLGFKPKYLCVYSTNSYYSNIYDENVSTTSFIRATSSGPLLKAFNSNYSGGLVSIDSSGFTLRATTSSVGTSWKYFAIG